MHDDDDGHKDKRYAPVDELPLLHEEALLVLLADATHVGDRVLVGLLKKGPKEGSMVLKTMVSTKTAIY